MLFKYFFNSKAQFSGITIILDLFPFPVRRNFVVFSNQISFTLKSHNSCALAPLAYNKLKRTVSRLPIGVSLLGMLRRREISSLVKYFISYFLGALLFGILLIFIFIF